MLCRTSSRQGGPSLRMGPCSGPGKHRKSSQSPRWGQMLGSVGLAQSADLPAAFASAPLRHMRVTWAPTHAQCSTRDSAPRIGLNLTLLSTVKVLKVRPGCGARYSPQASKLAASIGCADSARLCMQAWSKAAHATSVVQYPASLAADTPHAVHHPSGTLQTGCSLGATSIFGVVMGEHDRPCCAGARCVGAGVGAQGPGSFREAGSRQGSLGHAGPG